MWALVSDYRDSWEYFTMYISFVIWMWKRSCTDGWLYNYRCFIICIYDAEETIWPPSLKAIRSHGVSL